MDPIEPTLDPEGRPPDGAAAAASSADSTRAMSARPLARRAPVGTARSKRWRATCSRTAAPSGVGASSSRLSWILFVVALVTLTIASRGRVRRRSARTPR